jgi:hypothetical protein
VVAGVVVVLVVEVVSDTGGQTGGHWQPHGNQGTHIIPQLQDGEQGRPEILSGLELASEKHKTLLTVINGILRVR